MSRSHSDNFDLFLQKGFYRPNERRTEATSILFRNSLVLFLFLFCILLWYPSVAHTVAKVAYTRHLGEGYSRPEKVAHAVRHFALFSVRALSAVDPVRPIRAPLQKATPRNNLSALFPYNTFEMPASQTADMSCRLVDNLLQIYWSAYVFIEGLSAAGIQGLMPAEVKWDKNMHAKHENTITSQWKQGFYDISRKVSYVTLTRTILLHLIRKTRKYDVIGRWSLNWGLWRKLQTI